MQYVSISRDGPITTVTLNRPEVMNCINQDMHFELQAAFDSFAGDPTQNICLVTGAGDKAFCAGSDVRAAANAVSAMPTYPRCGYGGLTERFDCDKPIIAVVNGLALGGGFEIALACDLIVASERASFGLPEPLVGAIALGGGMHRLARRIPQNLAMGMILSSRRVSAHDAAAYGIVNEVVPHEELATAARRWCDDILRASPVAIKASKAITLKGLAEPDVETAMSKQADYPEFVEWRDSSDFIEGLCAFAERRAPNWSGR